MFVTIAQTFFWKPSRTLLQTVKTKSHKNIFFCINKWKILQSIRHKTVYKLKIVHLAPKKMFRRIQQMHFQFLSFCALSDVSPGIVFLGALNHFKAVHRQTSPAGHTFIVMVNVENWRPKPRHRRDAHDPRDPKAHPEIWRDAGRHTAPRWSDGGEPHGDLRLQIMQRCHQAGQVTSITACCLIMFWSHFLLFIRLDPPSSTKRDVVSVSAAESQTLAVNTLLICGQPWPDG